MSRFGTPGALASGSMFRDMSGAATTQALALAALAGAGQGATAAGEQGVANAAMAAQKDIEMAKIAAGLVTGGLAGGGGTVSAQGAKINEGKSLDARTGAPGSAGSAKPAGPHEAQAAEGPTPGVLALLHQLVGAGNGGGGVPTADDPDPQQAKPASTTGGARAKPKPAEPAPASSASPPPPRPAPTGTHANRKGRG